jgi:hypothetical protein
LNTFDAGVTLHLIDKLSPALAGVARSLTSTKTAAKALEDQMKRIHSTFSKGLILVGGGMALASPLIAATKSAMHLESALARVKIQTHASDAQMRMLNDTFTKTANATGIFSKPTLAKFASEMYSSGIADVNQINRLLPIMAKAADVTKLMSGGKIGPEETLHTLTALSHQFGRYDTKSMTDMANAAVAMSLQLPGGMKSLLGTGSTVNVPANRILGIDPLELMAFQAAVSQTSGSTGSGGKGRMSASNQINALMRAMPGLLGSGLLSGKSGFAAAVLGLGDHSGGATSMVNGKFSFQRFQDILSSFEKMSSVEIAQRMKKNVDMLGKKAPDEAPLINAALAGKVSKAQLMAQLFQWQFGSAGTVAQLIGDEKFGGVMKRLSGSARQAVSGGGIEKMQDQVMKTLEAQLTRLSTNFETLSSTIGSQIIPVITPLVEKLGDIVDQVNTFASAHPKITMAVTSLIALASASLIAAGTFNILKAGFMAMQFVSPAILTGATSALMRIGPALAGLRPIVMIALGLITRFNLPLTILSVAIASLSIAAVVAGNFIREHSAFFIHIAARVVHWVDTVNQRFQMLVSGLGNVASAIGNLIATLGGVIGKQLSSLPLTKGIGEQLTKATAGIKNGIDKALAVDQVTQKRDEKYLGSMGLGGLVNAIKGDSKNAAVANGPVIHIDARGANPDEVHAAVKKALDEHEKKKTRNLNHAQMASGGNSVGKSINTGGATRQ